MSAFDPSRPLIPSSRASSAQHTTALSATPPIGSSFLQSSNSAGGSNSLPSSRSLHSTPTPSPSFRPIREPIRIHPSQHSTPLLTPSPNDAITSPISGLQSPSGLSLPPLNLVSTAKERAERSRLFDEEFRLLNRRKEDEDEDESIDTESQIPFIQHSYQAFSPSSPQSGSNSPSGPFSSDDSNPSASPDESFIRGRLGRAFLLSCAILLSVGNSITWKRMLNRYASIDGSNRNLEFFVNQWTLLLYTLMCGLVLAHRWFFTDMITADQRAYPQKGFAVMGGLDGIAGLLGAVGGSVTAGQVQIVINQANIPITMLFSRIYLKVTSYTWGQYIGASVIIAGGLISAFGTVGEENSSRTLWYGTILIFIAVIPGAMSNVYKEEHFKEHNLDVFYLSTYVSVWQGLLSFACIPLFSLSYFGGIPLWQMPRNLVDGFHCFLGRELEGYACEIESPSSASLLLMFVFANFLYNFILLVMVKHGSALFLVIACAMALPLTNIVFTLPWVMGDDVESFSIYNMIGLALAVVGFLLYSIVEPSEVEPRGEFMVPTGAAGRGLYLTEYFPSASEFEYYYGRRDPERRHSFDFHSSPSIAKVRIARRDRVKKIIRDRTPSRTP